MMRITVDRGEYETLIRVLNASGQEKKLRSSLKKIINQMAADSRKRVYEQARNDYTVKRGYFKLGDLRLRRANASNLSAEINTAGETINLWKFKSKANGKRAAAKAQVKVSGTLKPIQKGTLKAFVAKMKNGHTGIFQRLEKGEQNRGSRVDGGQKKRTDNKIRALLGPSVAKMTEKLYEKMEGDIRSDLNSRTQAMIEQLIGGR